MPAPKTVALPAILLANDLLDGDVVFRTASGWSRNPCEALVAEDGEFGTAQAGQAVTLVLADEIAFSRGDVIAAPLAMRATSRPRIREAIEARVIVTGEASIEPGARFLVKLGMAMADTLRDAA